MFRTLLGSMAITTLLATTSVFAQDYPTRPITMTMPFSAGGPGDTLARVLAQTMTESLKQQVLIENAVGAGGTIGTAKVARSDPDGYTLLITHISHATNPALYRKLSYDTLTAFEPVGLVAELPMTLVSRKDFAPANFADLLAYVKANKDQVTYAHAGIGSASHLCGLLFLKAIETPITTVPYKGTGPAMNDLLGGQVDFMCDQTANTLSHIKADKIKVFGVTSKDRIAQLPDTPTLNEAGLPGFGPPQDCRRLQLLRDWSHDEEGIDEIRT
jgi:tripartite-type tricarboxylate transporter receptor subunit TctC